jgi:eukaryotic-like serine/threonine-protein kinase
VPSSERLELQLVLLLLGNEALDQSDLMYALSASSSQETLVDSLIASKRLSPEALTEAMEQLALLNEETVRHTIPDTQQHRPSQRVLHTEASSTQRSPSSHVHLSDPSALQGVSGRDRYVDIRLLGRGGMANVTLAHDRVLNREVALKAVRDNAKISNSATLLLTEARVTGLLDHPGIVPVYDIGSEDNGFSFYTMRAVSQPSLADQFKGDDLAQPSMSLEESVAAIRQVCLTVQYAHERGVIHRDLKPGNILLGDYGEIYVVDWGVARIVDETLGLHRTMSEPDGFIIGTMQYMSPEQARGNNTAIDARSDVYGLGGLLYFALTGSSPYLETNLLALRTAVINRAPEALRSRAPQRQIPTELSEICLKAMEKDPNLRYQSAKEMATELGSFMAGEKRRTRALKAVKKDIERGSAARAKWGALLCEGLGLRTQCEALESRLPTWAPAQEKKQLWAMKTEIDHLELEAERAFAESTRYYSQALTHSVKADEASQALGKMYWLRLEEAEAYNRTAESIAWEGRILQCGDEATRAKLNVGGSIRVETDQLGIRASLFRFEEFGRRLLPVRILDDRALPFEASDLKPGSYRLTMTSADGSPIHVPTKIGRTQSITLHVHVPEVGSFPEGWRYVTEGSFCTGLGPQAKQIELAPFAMMPYPVTCGEYLEFLNELRLTSPDLASNHAPRVHEDAPSYFVQDERGCYHLPGKDPEGDAWHPDWPIIMVNYSDCLAYAAWLGAKDGHPYRLPSSMEWQKAARGVDGRTYPWGYHFDATFCCMRDSKEGRAMPTPIGTFEPDTSPYGIRDMAGSVVEWTSSPSNQATPRDGVGTIDTRILEGSAYNSASFVCSLDFNMSSPVSFRHGHYGFRLALDVPHKETRADD